MSRMERRTRACRLRADCVRERYCLFLAILARKEARHNTYGVDVEYFQTRTGTEQPNSLVFTGSMDWMPNQDAISYFVKAILLSSR